MTEVIAIGGYEREGGAMGGIRAHGAISSHSVDVMENGCIGPTDWVSDTKMADVTLWRSLGVGSQVR